MKYSYVTKKFILDRNKHPIVYITQMLNKKLQGEKNK